MHRYNPFWIMLMIVAVAIWLTGMFRPFKFEPIYPPRGQGTGKQDSDQSAVKGKSTVNPRVTGTSRVAPIDGSQNRVTASPAAR